MNRLDSKTVFISGGRQGIGRAIVDRFLSEGAVVMTCGRGVRPVDLPKEVIWQKADVGNNLDVMELTQEIETTLGLLDVLINNAGIQIEKSIVETTDDEWDQLINTNAKSVFLMCRALIPKMTYGGSIINLGSISGKSADRNLALYNASKAFVHGLTRSIALDHGPSIRCNAICPGWVMSDMAEAAFSSASDVKIAQQDAETRHPIGRFGTPQDIAKFALWLASDESSFATGQCYTIDGGLTAGSPVRPDLF